MSAKPNEKNGEKAVASPVTGIFWNEFCGVLNQLNSSGDLLRHADYFSVKADTLLDVLDAYNLSTADIIRLWADLKFLLSSSRGLKFQTRVNGAVTRVYRFDRAAAQIALSRGGDSA